MIFQDPLSSLNPTHTVGKQIAEVGAAAPGRVSKKDAMDRAVEVLDLVGMPAGAGAGRRVPAPVLRRHAPARDDRDGAGLRAQAADRRRADDRAGRDHPEADPGAHRQPAAAAGHGGHPGHPRPRRDRRARGPGRGHVRGQGGGDHRHRRPCTPTRATPTPRRCSTRCRRSRPRPGSGCTRSPARRRTWSTRRRAAGSRRAAGTRPTRAAAEPPVLAGETAGARLPLLLPGRRRRRRRVGGQLAVVEPRAEPETGSPEAARIGEVVLSAENLVKDFPVTKGASCSAGSARSARSPTCRSTSARARRSAWSASPAAARPRSAGCSSAWTSRPAARSASAARTWPGRAAGSTAGSAGTSSTCSRTPTPRSTRACGPARSCASR